MKLQFSNIQKFLVSLAVIFGIAVVTYQSFLNKSRKVESYDDLHYSLSSVRVSIVKLEYLLDMFVVAGRSEGTTIELIKGDVDKIDESINALLRNPDYIDIINDNNLLSDGFTSIFDDWQTTKNEVMRLNTSLSTDGLMLLHNAVDMNTILVTEQADRLLTIIAESRKAEFNSAKGLALKSIVGFVLLVLIASLILQKKVFSRINAATAVARRISEGDLGARFRESSTSAAGRLGHELNLMLSAIIEFQTIKEEKNLELAAELSKRTGQIEALTGVLALAGVSISQNELFTIAVRECAAAGASDAAAVYIKEEASLRLKAQSGFDDIFLKDGSIIQLGEIKWLDKAKKPAVFKIPGECPSPAMGALLESCGFKSAVCVPLLYDREAIGILFAAFRESRIFMEEGAFFFEALASGIAVSAGHINLFQKELASKKFLERIIQQVPYGIAVFDRSGVCLMMNGALKRLLGAEHRPNFTGEYRIFDDEVFSSQGVTASIKKSYEGYSTEFIINYNPTLSSRYGFSGPARRLKVKSFPLYDAGGEISNIALLFEDIPDAAETSVRSGDII